MLDNVDIMLSMHNKYNIIIICLIYSVFMIRSSVIILSIITTVRFQDEPIHNMIYSYPLHQHTEDHDSCAYYPSSLHGSYSYVLLF